MQDYANALADAILYEEDPLVLESITQSIVGFRDSSESLYRLWPKLDRAGMNSFLAYAEKLEKNTWLALKRAAVASEIQKELFRAFQRFVITDYGAKKVEALLDGHEKIAGMILDQDKRWQLLLALGRAQSRGVLERVSKELELDPSSQGQQEAIGVRAAYGEVAFVADWQQRILSEENLNHADLRVFTSNLFTARQEQERADYANTFLSRLRGFLDDKNSSFLSRFLVMAPSGCLEGNRQMMVQFLEENKVSPTVEKALRQRIQLGERCQKVQKNAASLIKE